MADHPELFQGFVGDAVVECKKRMAALGLFKGPITNRYGEDIAGAAVKLQQQEKLTPVNGGFYAACWDALDRLESKQGAQPQQPPPKQPAPQKPPPPVKPAPEKAPPPPAPPIA